MSTLDQKMKLTIKVNGVAVTPRRTVNFTGDLVSGADNRDQKRTDMTVRSPAEVEP